MAEYTAEKLVKLFRSGRIVAPPYQREAGVWTNAEKVKLIVDILSKKVIPSMILNTWEGETSILDGLQRITNCRQYEEGWLSSLPTLPKYADLLLEKQDIFNNYVFTVQEVSLTPNEAYERFLTINNNGKRLTLGEKLRGMEFPARIISGGVDVLDRIATLVLSLAPTHKRLPFKITTRQDQFKIAVHLLANSGEEFIKTDRMPEIQEEFNGLSEEESRNRLKKLEQAFTTALAVGKLTSADQLDITEKRKISFLSQMVIAYIDQTPLTLKGAEIISQKISENGERFQEIKMLRSAGTHPYNFTSGTGKLVVEFLRQFVSDDIFRDAQREFPSVEKGIIRAESNGNCKKCGMPVSSEDEVFHHVKPHAEGGRSLAINGALIHRKCHTEVELQPPEK